MSIKGKAYIAGVFEHPLREIPHLSTAQVHAECAKGALEDAGLSKDDIDAYYCAGDAPGFGALSMADYMGLRLKHMDSTEMGGSSYIAHVGHAAEAIAAGKCKIALITLAGRPVGGRMGLADHRAPVAAGQVVPPAAAAAQAELVRCPRRATRAFGAARPTTPTACAPCATCMSLAPQIGRAHV